MIQVCPHCGQPQSIPRSPMQVSSWTSSFLSEHELSCFCYTPRESLEKLHEQLKRRLLSLMKEHFPTINSEEELFLAIDRMERDDPFRTEMSYRVGYLRRLKERLLLLSPSHEVEKQQKEEAYIAQRDGLHGRPQSMKDWMKGGR